MRAVIQRVNHASVSVEGRDTQSIEKGIVVLIGVGDDDADEDAVWLADKICGLRIFGDSAGKMNLSLSDIHGEILAISQFTLYGDCRKGKRPSYSDAAPPEKASGLYETVVQLFRGAGFSVKTGVFQAHMKVLLENDGPVTLLVDSRKTF